MSSLMIQATPIGERVWEWVTSDLQVTLPESEQESAQRAVERVALSVEQIAPQDQEMQVASLLYSYQQRTHSPLPELLVEQVGEPVMQLVEGSAEMTTLHAHQASVTIQSDHQHENLRKMLLAMAKDVRVVVIKLAAHLELMRSPGRLSQQEQVDNALLSRTILAPLANRLGIGVLKWQLEDYTFRTLEPEIYQTLSQQIDLKRREREDYIGAVIETIKAALKKLSLEGEVTGRSKHLYSIWKKMERKKVGVESLYDLNAVRILVESVTECYTALGVVHGLWNHIPKEFDDYIANPKGNNYRSIHTAVFGPEGQVLEIQIRTHNMHEAAELGVASHWRYKEGGRYDPGYERKIEWLRQLLEWKEEVAEQEVLSAPNEPLHSLGTRFRDEMAEEQIYILTPAGEVVELPEGGTALDFAYTIHSGLGHRTRGAKVDGKIVSLNQPLQSGQRVEILTVKEGGPTRDWMNPNLDYLHTSKARYRVRQWFRKQDFEGNVVAGRSILERELVRAGSPEFAVDKLLERYEQPDLESFYAAVGQGDITSGQIAGAINLITVPQKQREKNRARKIEEGDAPNGGEIKIRGVGSLMTSMANCCSPVYPNTIIGFITRSRGVTIHQQECPNALHLIETEPERVIEVSWSGMELAQNIVSVVIDAYDRAGLLRDITVLFSRESVNINSINTTTDKKRHIAHIKAVIELEKIEKLGKILDQLLRMRNIISASREN